LSHNNRAHEQLDRPDALQRDLALASSLVEAKLVSHLILGDGIGVINLVAENHERHLGKLFHREKSIELGLGLGESLVVLGVDKEDDTVDLGEVISPDTAS
jgi:hypothetical protein